MTLREIKKEIAKRTDKSFKEVNMVIDSLMEVILESLIDSDEVVLDPLGTFELQALLPLTENGIEQQRGSLIFRPRQETLAFMIKENLSVLAQEEEE